jgi:hypothetical protein
MTWSLPVLEKCDAEQQSDTTVPQLAVRAALFVTPGRASLSR